MRILVVDDQATNRAILTWLLEEDGHEVEEADDGEKALQAYKNGQFDIILMDVIMPVMDGLEATRQIKALQGDSSGYVPIIFLTALDDDAALSQCLESGGDDFLAKPYNEAVLKAKIQAHLRIRELTQQIAENNKELRLHNSRWQREQNIVEHIFTKALEHNLSNCPSLRSHVAPASTFNGDLLLSAPSPSGGLYVFLGDFTGHGLGASIGTLPIAHTFDQLCERHLSVGEIAFEFNRMLTSLLPDFMFCAATILELNSAGDSIQYWMGGLPDAYVIAADGSLKETLESFNMPLGVEHDERFSKGFEVKYLSPGERVFFYTDGLDEAESPEGEFFTTARIEQNFKAGVNDTLGSILDSLKSFCGDAEQRDDITLVEVASGPVHILDAQGKEKPAYEGLPWSMQCRLAAKDIKRANPVEEMMNILGAQTDLRPYRDVIGLLLAEMYSNALEHGILGLSSELKRTEEGFVEYYKQRQHRLDELTQASIDLKFKIVHGDTTCLRIIITDSGDGFETDQIAASDNDDSFGRGIALLKRVCTRMEYSEGGRRLEVDFPIDHATAAE